MTRTGRAFVALVAGLLCAVAPASALALDPSDSISLSPPSGTVYGGYPFAFTGGGSVDGNTLDGYTQEVLFTPSSSPILSPACPTDYNQTATAIEMAYGGPIVLAEHEAEGVGSGSILAGEAGPYSYTAYVNGDVIPTVTAPGRYLACAYLIDALDSSETLAVSPSPLPFTVNDPPGTGTPPQSFGGPPGKTGSPSNLSLTVAPERSPIRAPGNNLINVSGRYDISSGEAGLIVTVEPTSKYNGCASNDQQDTQIVAATGGAELTYYEQVTANQAGKFTSPIALDFKRRVSGSYVLCAYLEQFGDDIAVGFDRFTLNQAAHKPRHRAKPKPKAKSKPKPKAKSRHTRKHR
jgi:hypothetical protein